MVGNLSPTIEYTRLSRTHLDNGTRGFTARVDLDHTTAPADGKPINGHLVVINNTGAPITISDACDGWYAVGLSNPHVQRFRVLDGMVACAYGQVPIGTTQLAIQVETTFDECLERGGRSIERPAPPKCTGPGNHVVPPLPPGRYEVTVVFQGLGQQPRTPQRAVVTLTKP